MSFKIKAIGHNAEGTVIDFKLPKPNDLQRLEVLCLKLQQHVNATRKGLRIVIQDKRMGESEVRELVESVRDQVESFPLTREVNKRKVSVLPPLIVAGREVLRELPLEIKLENHGVNEMVRIGTNTYYLPLGQVLLAVDCYDIEQFVARLRANARDSQGKATICSEFPEWKLVRNGRVYCGDEGGQLPPANIGRKDEIYLEAKWTEAVLKFLQGKKSPDAERS